MFCCCCCFCRLPLHAKNIKQKIKKRTKYSNEPLGTKRGDESVECEELRLDVSDEGSGGNEKPARCPDVTANFQVSLGLFQKN